MDSSLKRARELRDNPKSEKKKRPAPEGLVRKEPQELIDMLSAALLENEQFRRTLDDQDETSGL